jgi:hypothetical protein
MCMPSFAFLLTIVPVSLLLTLSFFVLLSVKKAETKGLKSFGYVVAGILWAAVLVILLGGVCRIASAAYPARCRMRKMMMQSMPMQNMPMMQKDKVANISVDKNYPSAQVSKINNADHCGNKGIISKGEAK